MRITPLSAPFGGTSPIGGGFFIPPWFKSRRFRVSFGHTYTEDDPMKTKCFLKTWELALLIALCAAALAGLWA